MRQTIQAIFENGVLRPLQPIRGVADRSQLVVTVTDEHPLVELAGTLPSEDADEMLRIIEDEFERIDPEQWR